MRQFGFSVFAIDYRGFGKSDGDLPSEEMVYEDAHAGWAWLAQQQPDAGAPLHLRPFARRRGRDRPRGALARDERGAGAAGARAHRRVDVHQSLADVAAELSWSWLPTSLILSQKFDSIDKIKAVDMPVLVVHGAGDRFVPVALFRRRCTARRRARRSCC